MKQLDGTGMKRLHREWRRRTEGRLALVLDDVQGPFNVGAIIRTAAALRVDDLWLAGRTARARRHEGRQDRPRHPALPDVPPRRGRSSRPIDAARAAGYRVVGVELADGAVPLHELPLTDATCLVVGHEDRGCSPRDPRRLRRRRLPPPAGQGRVAQRGDRGRPSPATRCAGGPGLLPARGVASPWP